MENYWDILKSKKRFGNSINLFIKTNYIFIKNYFLNLN